MHRVSATDGSKESTVRDAAGSVAEPAGAAVADLDRAFAALLDRRELDVVFAPLLDLFTGQVVALEALVRGSQESGLGSAEALFAAARRAGRVAELDWACRAAAFTAFSAAEVPPSISLLVRVEPEGLVTECPIDLAPVIARAESRLRVFVEVDDRALIADPAGVLAVADRAREMGWGIVIDSVGSSPAPITMLPVVGPDAVKVDLRRLRGTDREASSAIIAGVLRHAEKTGATVLVEGIETWEDEAWARTLGGHCGEGPHLGEPGPLRASYPAPRTPIPLITVPPTDLLVASPFELFEGAPTVKMDRAQLDGLADLVAHVPRTSDCPSVFLLCMGDSDQIPADLVQTGLPEGAMFFVAFGTGMPAEPAAGVRGIRLAPGDAFAGELFLIVLGDRAPAAIFARPFEQDMFEAVVTQDFELVHEIARHIIRRVPAVGQDNAAVGGAVDDEDEVELAVVPEEEPELARRRGWRGWRSA
jgi:EAL domain-containing protein (putative c-di-GMP-specific phosphodiesterase class I)